MKWEDAAKYFQKTKEHLFDKPRRLSWIVNGLFLFFLTHAQEAFLIVHAGIDLIWNRKLSDQFTVGAACAFVGGLAVPFFWLSFCLIGAFLFSVALHRYLVKEIAPAIEPAENRQRFLLEGVQEAGLFRVYQSDPEKTIKQQSYSNDMRAKLGTSSRMRILTIAGYEYVGRGSDSLLWEGVRKRPDLHVEIVLLNADCEEGKGVIASRLQCLGKRDPSYDEDQLRDHIGKSLKTLKKLKAEHKGRFDLKLLKEHPLFRILILDDEMWISAYEPDAHGHESKVFHFKSSGASAWFSAFEALYEQASQRSLIS